MYRSGSDVITVSRSSATLTLRMRLSSASTSRCVTLLLFCESSSTYTWSVICAQRTNSPEMPAYASVIPMPRRSSISLLAAAMA